MLKDRIYEIYINKDYNCAESMLHAANEEYNLGLTEDNMKLLSGFGGGMCSENVCGCLSGAVAAVGKMLVKERAHVTDGFKEDIAALVERFNGRFDTTNCGKIKETHHKEDETRCLETLMLSAEVLDEYINDLKKANKI